MKSKLLHQQFDVMKLEYMLQVTRQTMGDGRMDMRCGAYALAQPDVRACTCSIFVLYIHLSTERTYLLCHSSPHLQPRRLSRRPGLHPIHLAPVTQLEPYLSRLSRSYPTSLQALTSVPRISLFLEAAP
jgi:hypothetical protein